jgi:mannosyltransferase
VSVPDAPYSSPRMATAVASPRARIPRVRPSIRTAGWVHWVVGTALLLILVALSVWHRTRALSGSFWMDEGLSVGIASHGLFDIPSLLHQDGSPPLYYMLLHVWMDLVGTTEARTHLLSVVSSVLTVPVGLWAGWSIFSPRVGWVCAFLCAINPFLTYYGQETRMYSLLALLGMINATLLVLVFARRKRIYLIPLVPSLAAILYTHGWGIFFSAAAVLTVVLILRAEADKRRELLIDGLIAFGGAAILFLPWLPTLLDQSRHTAAPWSKAPRLGAPIQISRGLLGGDRAALPLLLGAGYGLAMMFAKNAVIRRQDRTAVKALFAIILGTLAIAWIASHITPAWTTRYFGIILGPMLLLAAVGLVRARGIGIAALLMVTFFWINPSPDRNKSNVRDIAFETAPQMRAGDLVVSGQPEQMPDLAYYYGPGMRYAHTVEGKVQKDPYVMDWRDVVERYRATDPRRDVSGLVAKLKPGQHVLFVRPFTEGVNDWEAPWTSLVRRRSAQWGGALAADKRLRRVAISPKYYKGASTVGNTAVLYVRKS